MTCCNRPKFRSPLGGLIDSFFSDALPEAFPGALAPLTDIAETKDAFVISVQLPGIAERDIHVEMHEHNLKVRGERKDEREQEGTRWHRKEQRFGAFERTVSLPQTADAARIEAKLGNGVLTVTVPKTQKPQPVRVEIRTQD